MKTTVKLGETEAVTVASNGAGAVIELRAFGLVLARRSLTRAQARQLGDALGFASNEPAPAARPAGCTYDCDQGRRCTCGGVS